MSQTLVGLIGGTGIGEALIEGSRAERKAGEAAVKILVPSMLILISVVLIIFAPIIVRGIEGKYLQ